MLPVPPRESSPFPIAEVAEDYLRRRRHLLIRLERIERALRRWDRWETNRLLPKEFRYPTGQPALPCEILDVVQRLPTEEPARLDGGLR